MSSRSLCIAFASLYSYSRLRVTLTRTVCVKHGRSRKSIRTTKKHSEVERAWVYFTRACKMKMIAAMDAQPLVSQAIRTNKSVFRRGSLRPDDRWRLAWLGLHGITGKQQVPAPRHNLRTETVDVFLVIPWCPVVGSCRCAGIYNKKNLQEAHGSVAHQASCSPNGARPKWRIGQRPTMMDLVR